jgi:hypothetical protein
MTTSAAFHAFHQSHGLPVGSGHGLHSSPCQRVLACHELCSLDFVTRLAGLKGRYLYLGNVPGRHMLIAMAYVTGHLILAVIAQLPVRSDVGRDQGMACNTILCLLLLVLDGTVRTDPFPVAALKAVDFFKTQFFEFPCRPGTG